MDKDNLLLHPGSCLGSVPQGNPGELHQGALPSALAMAAPHPPPAPSWAGLQECVPFLPQLPNLSPAQPWQGTKGSVRDFGSAASN